MHSTRRNAFSLLELIVVAATVGVITAAVIPKLSAKTYEDPRVIILQYNLHQFRAQLEHFKLEHGGNFPACVNGALPQLTSSTNADGAIGSAGAQYPFGPYLPSGLPINPFDGRNAVVSTPGFPPIGTTSEGGWLYDIYTGRVAPNTLGHVLD